MKKIIALSLFIGYFTISTLSAKEFDAMAFPTLIDANIDLWYKTPRETVPRLTTVSEVTYGQAFSLLIAFSGYTADKNSKVHITFDAQVYDPQGRPTEDKGKDLIGYKGKVKNNKNIKLNNQYMQIVFTKKYPKGRYKINVKAYDKIANKTFNTEVFIALVDLNISNQLISKDEAADWLNHYYTNITPHKAFDALNYLVQMDTTWLHKNLHVLHFFKTIFQNNLFLLKHAAKNFDSFSIEMQNKLALISIISQTKELEYILQNRGKEFSESIKIAKALMFPSLNKTINNPMQLDMLWIEFLATGKYNPIRKIVSALSLKKYKGSLKKIKAHKGKRTDEMIRDAYFEATYDSAVWSLISNCKQMSLVFKYCIYMYRHDELDNSMKKQLASILSIVQKKLKEKSKSKK